MSCYESQDVTGSAGRVTETLELLHDTREKLKSDIRRFYNEHECDELLSLDFLDVVYGWLDCQAAITKKECADFWQEIAEDRDRAQMKCAELTAERDYWKDAFEDSERLRLELIEELEKRDKGIRRLKQRRGELMEQVRKLQDDAARARREE